MLQAGSDSLWGAKAQCFSLSLGLLKFVGVFSQVRVSLVLAVMNAPFVMELTFVFGNSDALPS